MRFRKPQFVQNAQNLLQAAREAQKGTSDEVLAAKAIAAGIAQGMTGEAFCFVMQTSRPDAVELSARSTLPEVVAWFKQDAAAAAILEGLPGFEEFARQYHEAAKAAFPEQWGIPS